MTPEKLRENDYTADELRKYAADSDDGAHLDPSEAAIILRAHAAALERLAEQASLEELRRMTVEGYARERDTALNKLAERDAEIARLKGYAEPVCYLLHKDGEPEWSELCVGISPDDLQLDCYDEEERYTAVPLYYRAANPEKKP